MTLVLQMQLLDPSYQKQVLVVHLQVYGIGTFEYSSLYSPCASQTLTVDTIRSALNRLPVLAVTWPAHAAELVFAGQMKQHAITELIARRHKLFQHVGIEELRVRCL